MVSSVLCSEMIWKNCQRIKRDRYITADDARDALFFIVHDCCQNDAFIMKLERLDRDKYRDVVTPANFREVNLAFYYVVKLQQYEVAAQFRDWNETVEEAIYNSPEFKTKRITCYNLYLFLRVQSSEKYGTLAI